jgi:hypothetical protein
VLPEPARRALIATHGTAGRNEHAAKDERAPFIRGAVPVDRPSTGAYRLDANSEGVCKRSRRPMRTCARRGFAAD